MFPSSFAHDPIGARAGVLTKDLPRAHGFCVKSFLLTRVCARKIFEHEFHPLVCVGRPRVNMERPLMNSNVETFGACK